jgi:hypothetical protein
MVSIRHDGLCRRLAEAEFQFGKVIQLDWAEKMQRIGTAKGAFL